MTPSQLRIPQTSWVRSAVANCAPVLFAVLAASPSRLAHAGCNIIPGTSTAFRGTLGVLDRPFARPNDVVALSLDPICDAGKPELGPTAEQNVVMVSFTPPLGAPRRLVVLAVDCAALASEVQTCRAASDVASAE